MKNYYWVLALLICNGLAAYFAHFLWNSSSMAAGAAVISLFAFGGVGFLLGGYLSGKKLYTTEKGARLMSVASFAVFIEVVLVALKIEHPSSATGPFPTSPWHEFGIVWLFIVMTTLWMTVQITRQKN